MKAPILAVIDGSKGLHKAVKTTWPWVDVQRCTKHKLENLYTHAPKRFYEQIKSDYHEIVYAESEDAARKAWKRFEKKWSADCPAVVDSLNEGGDELLTFFRLTRSLRRKYYATYTSERKTNFPPQSGTGTDSQGEYILLLLILLPQLKLHSWTPK